MSLILTFKANKFGAIYSDGRVTLLREGKPVGASPGETVHKFRLLRPDMVIAGSSSFSMEFDLRVYDQLQSLAKNLSEDCSKNFGTILDCVPHVVNFVLQSYPAECGAKRSANFHLIGFDREQARMRSVVYSLEGSNWKIVDSKAAVSGFIEPTEGWAEKLLTEVGDDPTPEVVLRTMARMAEEIAAQHPEAIGSAVFVLRGETRGARMNLDYVPATKVCLNKHLDNIPDGASFVRMAIGDTTGNRVDFSKPLLNKHLDNIPDGTSYARTTPSQRDGGGRAYTALDANNRLAGTFRNNLVNVNGVWTTAPALSQSGTTTTINVGASTSQFGDGQVSYSAGSVNPGAYGTYYIYADDPTFAGGAVTYQATTSKPTVVAGNGRQWFGVITTASGGGGTGGGGTTCPAEDQIMQTRERGFVPAVEIQVDDHVLDFEDGISNRVLDAWSVKGLLVYVTVGGETYHVDIDHQWLLASGNPASDSGDWIRQRDLKIGDLLEASDGTGYPVTFISEPHAGRYRKIICERHRMRMGKLIAHNYSTL